LSAAPLTLVPAAPSPGDLADELGRLKASIDELEDEAKAVREKLIKCGLAEVEGKFFRATVTTAVSWRIQSAKVKLEMGSDWWDSRCKQTVSTTVRVAPRAAIVAAAIAAAA
jgi:hypothetical protein